jgi:hypothetical protein
MSDLFSSFPVSDNDEGLSTAAGNTGLFTKNNLTTAGVLVAAGTGVAGVALVTAVLPAQVLAASGISAGLIYAGDRQHKGLPLNPMAGKAETTPVAAAPAAA